MVCQAKVILGDCLEVLKTFDPGSIDLIVTSPPYSNRRKSTYGGTPPDKYINWFLPISKELKRVLKPEGTFILNIKEHCEGGTRHTYVIRLILALIDQGWLWTEEFIWHKKSSYPGKWPNRFRDSWERLLQFNKQRQFDMYQEAVMQPAGKWSEGGTEHLLKYNTRHEARTQSGFGVRSAAWAGRDMVYPNNVLHMSVFTGNKEHSAVFPATLPTWFIKLFTEEGDTVLDPFAGSGTTLLAARELLRDSIGIEILPGYVDKINGRLNAPHTPKMF